MTDQISLRFGINSIFFEKKIIYMTIQMLASVLQMITDETILNVPVKFYCMTLALTLMRVHRRTYNNM